MRLPVAEDGKIDVAGTTRMVHPAIDQGVRFALGRCNNNIALLNY